VYNTNENMNLIINWKQDSVVRHVDKIIMASHVAANIMRLGGKGKCYSCGFTQGGSAVTHCHGVHGDSLLIIKDT